MNLKLLYISIILVLVISLVSYVTYDIFSPETYSDETTTNGEIIRLYPNELIDTQIWGYTPIVISSPGTTLYFAGQGAIDKDGNIIGDTMDEQMNYTYDNIRIGLEAAGAKPEHVVQIIMLMVDYDESYLSIFEREMDELFGKDHLPASMLIPVPRLALDGMLFEIQVTAVIPQ